MRIRVHESDFVNGLCRNLEGSTDNEENTQNFAHNRVFTYASNLLKLDKCNRQYLYMVSLRQYDPRGRFFGTPDCSKSGSFLTIETNPLFMIHLPVHPEIDLYTSSI